ncbi:MFS transporter [Tepidibacillus marianensis]|uniref:MFS transporter n=1 Tax=Tepidibacillus marianensis TaxID=3131995 RepID=UPI0030CD54A2
MLTSFKRLFTPYRGLPKEVYVLFIAKIINAMGSFVLPLLTIILIDAIGLSKQTAGLFISIAGVLFIPASMLGGKLADSIGRKKVILIFDTLSSVLYIVIGFMEPSMMMVYMIALASMAMVTAGPAHDSLIADVTTPETRNGAYALSYMGWNIGFAIGPIIGGVLYKNHLPLVFIGDALTALIAIGLISFFIKETIDRTKEDIVEEERKLERREEGSIFSVLLKRPILIYFSFFAIGYSFAYSQWSYLLPMNIMDQYPNTGAKYFGILSSFNGFVVMIFTPILTKMMERIVNIRKVVYGVLFYAVGFGMLGFLNQIEFFSFPFLFLR